MFENFKTSISNIFTYGYNVPAYIYSIAEFELFIVDDDKYDGTNLNTNNTFKMAVYGGNLSLDGEYYKGDTTLCSNGLWTWTANALKDDNGVEYKYNVASAKSKYTAPPTDGTPSYLNMRVEVIGNEVTTYTKWNTAENWQNINYSTIKDYDGPRGLKFYGGANIGISNFKVYRRNEFMAELLNDLYDVNTGKITLKFNSRLADELPEKVAISDGTNSYECNLAKVSDSAAEVIIPDGLLANEKEYKINISNIISFDGRSLKNNELSFKTESYMGELVEDEKFESGSTTYKSILSFSRGGEGFMTTNSGYLTMGYNQNTATTVNSYSDYIVQFDYNPYYHSTSPRMIFTIAGYSFHMIGMSAGVQEAQGVTSGATITKTSGLTFTFPQREWSTIIIREVNIGYLGIIMLLIFYGG